MAGGEQEYSQRRFRWMIANRGVDVVQPDLQYYGGLVRSIRVARMAEVTGLPTTVHISGGFGFVYILHFASCVKDVGAYQEYKLGLRKYASWFDPPLQIRNGSFVVPAGPGVGIAGPQDFLRGARVVIWVSRFKHHRDFLSELEGAHVCSALLPYPRRLIGWFSALPADLPTS